MNTATFTKKISELSKIVKKDGRLSVYGKSMIDRLQCLQSGDKVFPKYWRRAKGYCTLCGTNEYSDIKAILRTAGIEFITGNDAPKGGAEGDFIALTAKGRR